MVNIVGLSNLRDRQGDRENDEHTPTYYAGGASQQGGGSGLSVIGPGDGTQRADFAANIIERARREAQSDGTNAGEGTGPRHIITFYRDGFTVNDGPYRARSDPANRPFLEAIEAG